MLKKFKVEKLGRNNTVQRFINNNIDVKYHVLTQEEYLQALKAKLIEEAKEVACENTKEAILDEMADVIEVFYALCKEYKISTEELEQARLQKVEERGVFDKKIYIENITMEDSNPKIQYFLDNSEKYPEFE